DVSFRADLIEALLQAASVSEAQGNIPMKLRRALSYYTEVLTLKPENTDARTRRGDVYAALGMEKESLADFQRTVERDSRNPDTFRRLGWAFVALGKPAAALEPW